MANGQGLYLLTSLTISCCYGMLDDNLEAIGMACRSLKHLFLAQCSHMSDFGLVAFSRYSLNLETLSLEQCYGITLPGVVHTISEKAHSNLRSLTLVNCMGVRDALLLSYHLLPFSRSLQSLIIKDCVGLGSDGLVVLGKLCPILQHFKINGLYAVTDSGLISFLNSREPKLVKVNLSRCLSLPDKAIAAVVGKHGGALKELNRDHCENITDAAMLVVASNCIVLKDLRSLENPSL